MTPKPPKDRLDALLVRRGLVPTRQQAQAHVMRGNVLVDGQPCTKPGTRVADNADVALKSAPPPFVSRGGEKLSGALDAFRLDVAGLDALDIGASTGGFTDCLLQRGARSVVALDVGRAQLHPSLLADPRVTVIDRLNFRHVTPDQFPRPFHCITIDVSFISLSLILPPAAKLLLPGGCIVALVKPQFEAGRARVRKGVVRDRDVHRDVLIAAAHNAADAGLHPAALTPSPIKGPKGNVEFFYLLRKEPPAAPFDLEASVDVALRAVDEMG